LWPDAAAEVGAPQSQTHLPIQLQARLPLQSQAHRLLQSQAHLLNRAPALAWAALAAAQHR